jgi:hypothetical protein
VAAFTSHARWQAGWCARLGSPFMALLTELIADRLDFASSLGRRLAGWPGDPTVDALVLRLAGGLHARVRAGQEPALAALYPPAPLPDADMLWARLEPALADPALLPWLDSAPQTNEVGRSAVLMPGLMTVASETALPLRLFELGASAGLNLVPDRYAYRLGGVRAGDAGSPLRLAPRWEGADPPVAAISVAERAGVDLHPLDVGRPADRARMLAYVWPDQHERLARMEGAMAIAAADPPRLLAGDAAAFIETRVFPSPKRATVVFHSIAFQYFPAASQQRIASHMAAAGAAATQAAPLGWLRFEADDPAAGASPTLRLRLWPGEDRLLAKAHPHGDSVVWLA